MSFFSIIPSVGGATGLFLLGVLPAVAQAPDSTATVASARPTGTLIKLGTGFTRGLEIGGYRGLSVPLVLSAEHHLTPAVSLFANAFSGINLGRRYRYYDGSHQSIFGDFGFDAGVRYYYNQEKRRRKGRATGPFTGNYVALQSTSVFNPNSYYRSYHYSTLTAIWGMQRRMGKYGWFDAYVGAGVAREPGYRYYNFYGSQNSQSRYLFAPEIGIKFSLGSRLTR